MNPVGDIKLEPQRWIALLSGFLPRIDGAAGAELSSLGAEIAGQVFACHYNFFIFNQDRQAVPLKAIYERLIPHVRLERRWFFFTRRPPLPPGFSELLRQELQNAIEILRSCPGGAAPPRR